MSNCKSDKISKEVEDDEVKMRNFCIKGSNRVMEKKND